MTKEHGQSEDDGRGWFVGPDDDPQLVCADCSTPPERHTEDVLGERAGEPCSRCGLYWEYASDV